MIHRSGEWMMLMLGESIFSLLIVDVKDKGVDFYLVFYFSLLTVILLQLLHFQSEPHQADIHAARRNKNAGMIWASIQYVYSLSLVTMGASSFVCNEISIFQYFDEYFDKDLFSDENVVNYFKNNKDEFKSINEKDNESKTLLKILNEEIILKNSSKVELKKYLLLSFNSRV